MAVKFIDNTAIVQRQINANCTDAMAAVAEVLVESVQEKMLYGYSTPHGKDGHTEILETGELFDSIQAEPGKASQNTYVVSVGSDVSYASYPHDGTSKLEGRPYIRDGVMDGAEKVRETLESILPNGFLV